MKLHGGYIINIHKNEKRKMKESRLGSVLKNGCISTHVFLCVKLSRTSESREDQMCH